MLTKMRLGPPFPPLFRTRWRKPARRDWMCVRTIRQLQQTLQRLPDQGVCDAARRLRDEALAAHEWSASRALPRAFALGCEAVRRLLGLELHDEQVLASLVLATTGVAELATGEGKTVAAVPATYLASLPGTGVHVATANSYLAERDATLLAPVYELLGTSLGLLRDGDTDPVKRQAYACDVTYGSGYEFGFDYLRDQHELECRERQPLGMRLRQAWWNADGPTIVSRQRGHHWAIVDEVDSVLIDEARTPLLLATGEGRPAVDAQAVLVASGLSAELVEHRHFTRDPGGRTCTLSAQGEEYIAARRPPTVLLRPWPQYVDYALQARHCLRRNVHYVVDGCRLCLVDEYTGRIFADRTWQGGLQQAVQAGEGLPVLADTLPAGRISRQRCFQLYARLAGMTGTARESAREFYELFGLPVVSLPTHRRCLRQTWPARAFATDTAKWSAIAESVTTLHASGRPVLIGCRTIENSQRLAALLRSRNLAFTLLNGCQDRQEAEIIAAAGARGAITIATNMAGRGSDIKLAPDVAHLGGLHVIGGERHEARRIDRQLAGRAARQGDPGSVQFFLSADDDLIARHQPRWARRWRRIASRTGELPAHLDRHVVRLQVLVEYEHYRQRARLNEADQWHDDLAGLAFGAGGPSR